MSDIRRFFNPVILRAIIYTVLLALITTGTMLLPGESFHEGKIVEWMQFMLLFFSTVMFIFAAFRNTDNRELSLVLAGFLSMAGIRECDRFLDHLICDNFWKVGVSLFFSATAVLIYRKHKSILKSVERVIHWNSFGMLLSGFLVLLFSRLFGHNEYWSDIIGRTNQKVVLRVIEETTELLAYFIFLAGSTEFAIRMTKPPADRQ